MTAKAAKKSAKKVAASPGRPPVLADAEVVYVDGANASTLLQSGSDRRAVINRLVELGGRAQVQELNLLFGYDVRPRLLALMREGWLGALSKRQATLPRRNKSLAS